LKNKERSKEEKGQVKGKMWETVCFGVTRECPSLRDKVTPEP
jgi:hypothetical protein